MTDTRIPIPPETEEDMAQRLYESFLRRADARIPVWRDAPEQLRFIFRDEAREMLAGVLSAWPGADTAYTFGVVAPARLILPLPQEARDD